MSLLLAAAAIAVLSGHAEQGGLLFGTAPADATALSLDDAPVARAPGNRFMLGFGRDAPATATLRATLADGTVLTQTVVVSPRQYSTQSIPGLARTPVPDAEFEARRPAELAKLKAARAGVTAADGWSQPFTWPASGRVSGVYGSQRILGGVAAAPHAGVDLAVPAGTPVVAPAAGIVRLAEGPFTLEGNVVLLDHGYGLISAFLHLSRIDVAAGQYLRQGERIGLSGATGRATGPHLHWGMTWGPVRIDPALLVTGR